MVGGLLTPAVRRPLRLTRAVGRAGWGVFGGSGWISPRQVTVGAGIESVEIARGRNHASIRTRSGAVFLGGSRCTIGSICRSADILVLALW